jgi:hypothetical protein
LIRGRAKSSTVTKREELTLSVVPCEFSPVTGIKDACAPKKAMTRKKSEIRLYNFVIMLHMIRE